MMRIFRIALILPLFLLPFSVFASVRINEIAWMGTADSANDEWLELYNAGGEAVNLDGWILEAVDGTPKINLSGVIQASGFFLLERTDDTTLLSVVADLIYTGALSNTGEVLVLKNSQGAEIDRVDGSSSWQNIGGDNNTKETPQLTGAGWITATGTPRIQNAGAAIMPSSSQDSLATSTADSNTAADSSSSASPESVGSQSSQNVAGPVAPEPTIFSYIAGGNRSAIAGAEIILKGEAYGLKKKPLESGRYLWNFGDGGAKEGKSVGHAYVYPGSYIAVLNVSSGYESAQASIVVSVIPNQVEISEAAPGGRSWIELKNGSDKQVDISRWVLESADKRFFFPEATFIRPQAYLTVPFEISGLEILLDAGFIKLLYPNGQTANHFAYEGVLKEGESFVKNGSDVVAGIATPGSANQITKPAALEKQFVSAPVLNNVAAIKENLPLKNEAAAVENRASGEAFVAGDDSALKVENSEIASVLESKTSGSKTKTWFFIALASGIFGAAGFFFFRRIASE